MLYAETAGGEDVRRYSGLVAVRGGLRTADWSLYAEMTGGGAFGDDGLVAAGRGLGRQ